MIDRGNFMITSTSNQRIKRLLQLMEKSRIRSREGLFAAEGIRMFLETPLKELTEIYIAEGLWQRLTAAAEEDKYLSQLGARIEDSRKSQIFIEQVSDEVFRKMSDTCSPQGILFVARQRRYALSELIDRAARRSSKGGRSPLFLLLEDIQDPGNLGTMIRTAEGAGADGVIMSKNTVDIYNPKVIRSTMGSLYRVPFLYAEDLLQAAQILKQEKITLYAAHLAGESFYDEIDYQGGSAFLIGNEGNGLSREITECAQRLVRIPMEGKLESLNAAVSAALLLYQAAGCQRKGKNVRGEKA